MIDIGFDMRSDTPPGKDPDAYSPTLRRYHQLLWSKPFPTARRSNCVRTGSAQPLPPLRARRVLVVE